MFHYAKSILQTTIEDVGLSLSSRNLPEDGYFKIVFLETIWLYDSFKSYLDII